jgi:hypothetical protein
MFHLLLNKQFVEDTIIITDSYAEQLRNLQGEGMFHARSSLYSAKLVTANEIHMWLVC